MSTIIMIHGFGASFHQWKFLSGHLASSGLQIHTVELLGHGTGNKSTSRLDYSIENAFERLVDDIEKITQDQLILIGHSLGGYLSILFTHKFPARVKSLILINPLFTSEQIGPGLKIMNQLGKNLYSGRDHFPENLLKIGYRLSRITHPHFSDEVRTTLVEGAGCLTPKVLYLMDTFQDLSDIIPDIETPTLLIWGDQDSTLHPDLYPHLAELLTPEKIYIFEHEDHSPHLTQPAVVSQTITDFLNHSSF